MLVTHVNKSYSIVMQKSGLSRLTLVELEMLMSIFQATLQGLCPYLVIGSPNSPIVDVPMGSHRSSKTQKKCEGLHDAILDF